MGENAKRQDGNERTLSISVLKSIKLYVSTKEIAGKYEDSYEEYMLLLKLGIYLLISFIQHVDFFRQFF